MDFHKWLSWVFDTYIMTKRLKIAITIWDLWYARNKLVHEGTNQRAGELVVFIRSYCKELAALTFGALHSNQSTSVKSVIGKIIFTAEDFSEINVFTWEANKLSKAFRVCHFQYIGRSKNRDIRAMAHDGLLRGKDRFWVEEALDLVVVVAAEEHRLVKPP
ncbi:hypothetical protein PVK06_027726 [Gossypium arboreum]|uniref:Uncharacterized protein n=1 Tax=Gossypium arboreum TaxID=29729 RepID=A0ABR0P1B5_GOSAR|nr:hypothetical protein PVK06_027726 [Gossypium arboreum]